MFRQIASAAAVTAAMLAATPASASTTIYSVAMNGASEAPPNSSPATGQGLVTFNDVALTMTISEQYVGLTGGPVTGAHIHCCTVNPYTGTAAVVVDFMSASFPTTTSGNYDNTFNLTAATFAALSGGAAAGKAYLNIHNAVFPAGEIRGFLVPQVPEPSTYGLMLGGLGALGLCARRRKRAE